LDHPTDIYSLGVTLYELLTLQSAFSGQDRKRLMRQILEEDPRPPRQLNQAVPKDLETIILKAVAKEASARYATAGELAEDLRRFLNTEPIRARRPSLLERTAKWSRRHRSIVGAAAAALVVAVLALSVSTALVSRAYQREATQRDRAEANLELVAEEWVGLLDRVHSTSGQLQEAVASWDAAVQLNPQSPVCFRSRGWAHLKNGDVEQAIADHGVALHLDPNDRTTYKSRAYAYFEIGELDRAIEDYTSAIRLDPTDFTAYAWRGLMYSRTGEFDKAILDYTTAIRVDVKLRNPSTYVWRGLSHSSKGDIGRAMADYDRAIQLVPDYTFAYCCRAAANMRLGQEEDALRDINRTDEVFYRDFVDLHVVSWFLATCPDSRLRRPKRAVQLAEEGVRLRPKTGFVLLTLGVAQYRAGDLEGALVTLERSTGLPSRFILDPAAWFSLAMVQHRLGSEEQARKSYDEAVRRMESGYSHDEEIRGFQREAAQLLGAAKAAESATPGADSSISPHRHTETEP
jgi:tetratricopeptide (TPR) repeat protein